MSVSAGPKSINRIPGLVVAFDVNSPRSNLNLKNIITPIRIDGWQNNGVGGSATYFARNGTDEENRRIIANDMNGLPQVVWEGYDPLATADNNGDGGWNSTYNIPCDPNKMYRWTVWIKRPNVTNGIGNTYLGLYAYDKNQANIGVQNSDGLAINTNFYWYTADLWSESFFSNTEWYLIVGHAWPAGTAAGNVHPQSGIWAASTKDKKGGPSRDGVFLPETKFLRHRSYLFYETSTTANQYFYRPRVEVCDGTQAPISELLEDSPQKLLNIPKKDDIVGSSTIFRNPLLEQNSSGAYYYHMNSTVTTNTESANGTDDVDFFRTIIDNYPVTNRTVICAGEYPSTDVLGMLHRSDSRERIFSTGVVVIDGNETYHTLDIGSDDRNVPIVIAYSFNGVTAKAYRDGELTDTVTMTAPMTAFDSTTEVYNSGIMYSGTDLWKHNGKFYCLYVFDSALSDEEIRDFCRPIKKRLGIA